MIIKRVKINKLFGFLNYDLVFPEGRKVIITGPNGFGKTMILNILFAYMQNDIDKLMSYPFRSVDIFTSSGDVSVENDKLNDESKFNEEDDFNQRNVIMINSDRANNIEDLDERIREHRDLLVSILNDSLHNQKKVISVVRSMFSIVHTENRLGLASLPPMVNERLVGIIQRLKESNRYGFFPELNDLLESNVSVYYSNETDGAAISGLISEFFSMYNHVADTIKRVSTFIEIVNGFEFAFKKIVPCSKHGFAVKNIFNELVEIDKLSSGEKNIISIMFDLIFKTENGATILIDEPEISLHVSWQRDLIYRFEQISECSLYNQLIIATHSPEIINDDWESSIDLYANHEVCR